MGRRGYLMRYQCNNLDCVCDFFRGGSNECCPICDSGDVKIIARNVGD